MKCYELSFICSKKLFNSSSVNLSGFLYFLKYLKVWMENDNNHETNINSNPIILIPHCFSEDMAPAGVIFKRSRPKRAKKRNMATFHDFDRKDLYFFSCSNKNHKNLMRPIMPLIVFLITHDFLQNANRLNSQRTNDCLQVSRKQLLKMDVGCGRGYNVFVRVFPNRSLS